VDERGEYVPNGIARSDLPPLPDFHALRHTAAMDCDDAEEARDLLRHRRYAGILPGARSLCTPCTAWFWLIGRCWPCRDHHVSRRCARKDELWCRRDLPPVRLAWRLRSEVVVRVDLLFYSM
jgi:hypothetical protein